MRERNILFGRGIERAMDSSGRREEIGHMDRLNAEMDSLTRLILRLDAEKSVMEERLRDELEHLYLFRKVSFLLSATLNLEQVLRVVVNAVVRDLGYENCCVYLTDEETKDLVLTVSGGFDVKANRDLKDILGTLLVSESRRSGEPTSLATTSSRITLVDREFLQQSGISHIVLAPAFSQGELVGGIVASRRGQFSVTSEHLRPMALLANQTALAVTNSRLYRKIEEYSRNLERQVAERTKELTAAYRELQASREQLVEAGKMSFLGQLTAGIAHEMNTPIGAVAYSLRVIEDLVGELKASAGSDEVLPDDYRSIASDMEKALVVAQSAIEKAGTFVRTIKTQTRDLASVEERVFQPLDVIRDVEILLSHEMKRTFTRIEVESSGDDLSLCGDPGKFSQVITNLVNNSIDAYEGVRGGVIWIRLYSCGPDLVVEVEDHGIGIAQENKKRLFKDMFTTKPQGKGTGLGLSIIYGIVTGHFQGTISVESLPGVGTTFTLCLPHRRAQSEE
jgi:signal transduction histidine kinase